MSRRLFVAAAAAVVLAFQPASGLAQNLTRPVTFEQWDQVLTDAQGDIVVVDFWATWCDSCIKRFPKMVELDAEYRARGVRFMSMLLEDPEEPGVLEMAEGFLRRQEATFEHFRMVENLMASFELLDLIGIPAVFIYDRQGQLAHRLTGDDPRNQFDDEDIAAALDAML